MSFPAMSYILLQYFSRKQVLCVIWAKLISVTFSKFFREAAVLEQYSSLPVERDGWCGNKYTELETGN
jgi:hypothetical protein